MSRIESILKHVDRQGRGIEIGPWFNPIVPRSRGFNSYVLDVFDQATLILKAKADPNIDDATISNIEEVDFVGSSIFIDEVVVRKTTEQFDYIVSSHNFEHLPNPIRFLQGCGRVMKEGAVLAMAIPDHRVCFDFFRPATLLHEWIDAYLHNLDRPTPTQHFAHRAYFAAMNLNGVVTSNFLRDTPIDGVYGPNNLRDAYVELLENTKYPNETYHDSHCSVFTPSSFQLLILDCRYLALIPFDLVEVFDAGCEFHAHLRHTGYRKPEPQEQGTYLAERNRLMHAMLNEAAASSSNYRAIEHSNIAEQAKARIIGAQEPPQKQASLLQRLFNARQNRHRKSTL